jgi:hypothetical protein
MLEPTLAHEAPKTTKSSAKQLADSPQEMSPTQRKNGTDSLVPGDSILRKKNASFPRDIPHPTSLRQLSWIGEAYVVTAGRQLGIFKTW